MLTSPERTEPATYLNPVHSRSFPDPFVLKFRGEYYAYSTGFAEDGNVFEVIRSSDLVNWTPVGGAMPPLENSPPYYWAPEVTYHNGKFYLYYSVGNEVLMELRVALSERPDGGFEDSGRKLTSEDFAIDPHVFTDGDGQRYLFYATDFLGHTHIGTGTVVDRMTDWFTLDGDPHPVTRAKYDWQVYDPNRKEKGGVRWHTVEGPCVLKRKTLYYEMFSGGNWQNTSYGVSFAVSDNIRTTDEWLQFSDGDNVLPILRTLPGIVVGPGHNSIVRGPNNRELYCVYHRWVDDHRVMAIDRMDFAGDRIFVIGPSYTPQPRPFRPTVIEKFRTGGISATFVIVGECGEAENGFVSGDDGRNELVLAAVPESFLCEFEIEPRAPAGNGSAWGFSLKTASGSFFRLDLNDNSVVLTTDEAPKEIAIPNGFCQGAPALFRLEVDCRRISLKLDQIEVCKNLLLDAPATGITIFSDRQSIRVGVFELTEGFEELFETNERLEENGWQAEGCDSYSVGGGELTLDPEDVCWIAKGSAHASVEYAANFRLFHDDASEGGFGLMLRPDKGEEFRFGVDLRRTLVTVGIASFPLPDDVRLTQHHQLRIIKREGTVIAYFDDINIGEFLIDPGKVICAVYSDRAKVAVEMIRLTAI